MDDSDLGFEMVASSLRADAVDMKTFVEVLGGKLESALPGLTTVVRKGGGMFSRERRVSRIEVALDDTSYSLVADGNRVETTVGRVVRGIVLKTERVPLEQWIETLSRDLAEHARSSEQARLALERLLGA